MTFIPDSPGVPDPKPANPFVFLALWLVLFVVVVSPWVVGIIAGIKYIFS